jgi:transcriptional regulator with XRE-family HTH domain
MSPSDRALRSVREQRGLSQEQLDSRSRLHRNYVGGCEREEINLSFDILLRLANGLETRLSELMARYEELD